MGQNSSSISIKNFLVNIQAKDGKIFQMSYHSLVEHIILLRSVIQHPEITKEGPTLDFFIQDYCQRMIDGEMKTEEQQSRLPWQTDWIWHVHRLHPIHYLNDCTKQLRDGLVQKKALRLIHIHTENELLKKELLWPKSYFSFRPSLDLRKAVIRQNEFLKNFQNHTLYSYDLKRLRAFQFENFVQDYVSFLKLANKHHTIVPTFDIDLIWHTHMRYPSDYREFCENLCGFILDHDDAIESSKLKTAYKKTAEQWKEKYQSEYGSSRPMVSNSTTMNQSQAATNSGCGSGCAFVFHTHSSSSDSSDGGDGGCGGGCGGD